MENNKIELGTDMCPCASGKPMKLNLSYTPEMIEDIKNRKGFDLEAYDAEIKKIEIEQEIENVAWQFFLNKSQLSFKRDLTSDERKSIIGRIGDFNSYREEAIKFLDKKQKALLNKKYPIIDIPADGISGMYGGAYCLCFVYSKYKGNFVLRGYVREVEKYLNKNYTHYFCNKSLWHKGFNRDIWSFWKDNVGIFIPSIEEKKKGKKIEIRPYSWIEDSNELIEFKCKRIPKRWISIFDKL